MPPYWQCPRCRWRSTNIQYRCEGCGLEAGRVDTRMLEEMRYEIRDLRNTLTAKKEKNMSTLGSMMKRLLDKDTQALVKAGYINGDLELTEKGKGALWAILFSANKEALVAEAKEIIEEEKKV